MKKYLKTLKVLAIISHIVHKRGSIYMGIIISEKDANVYQQKGFWQFCQR